MFKKSILLGDSASDYNQIITPNCLKNRTQTQVCDGFLLQKME